MEVKRFFTFEEQLKNIENKGFIISDYNKSLNFLRHINFYSISVYLSLYKQRNSELNFDCVCQIYEFDRKIRTLIFSVIEEIELYLRTQFAYYHAGKYGPLGYLDNLNFNKKHKHDDFIQRVNTECIKKNARNFIIKHHNYKYEGKIPLWVIIEFFSVGTLAKFYADMDNRDKRLIAKELFCTSLKHLDSWLKCLTVLRNKCAHYSRIYALNFLNLPKMPHDFKYKNSYKLFDQLLMLKFLYTNPESWNNNFMVSLQALIEEYSSCISLDDIGFPENWESILKHYIKELKGKTQ